MAVAHLGNAAKRSLPLLEHCLGVSPRQRTGIMT